MNLETLQQYAAATNQELKITGIHSRVSFHQDCCGDWFTCEGAPKSGMVYVKDASVKNKRKEFTVMYSMDELGLLFVGRENTGAGSGHVQNTLKKQWAFEDHISEVLGMNTVNAA